MSELIRNRYDFVLIFDVKDGNPNGDPDAGNLPRLDPETGQGLVTDVCLKRKVRNFVQLTKVHRGGQDENDNDKFVADTGYDIYIKEKAVLGRAHFKAFKELSINTGEEARIFVNATMFALLSSLETTDGISFEESDDESGFIVIASDADKKELKKWLKEAGVSKEIHKLISNAIKEAKPRMPTAEETEQGRDKMCKDYYDIRTFGAVMSLKSAPNCGQVRGPVQLTFARSVDPIVTLEHSITRMAVATEAEAEKQGGDNRTMGRKHTVPYGIYVAHGFISPALAAQTGFTEDDLTLLWDALRNMFEHDHSAARGEMSTVKLVVFKHESALGNAPSRELFNRVKVIKKDAAKPARSVEDYEITVDKDHLPQGVELSE
jgi:CRISPR-associated protein Csd2